VVPLFVGDGSPPDALAEVAAKVGVEIRVIPPAEDMDVATQLLDAAAEQGLDAVALGQVIEDRAAAVLGGLVFDGALAPLPSLVEAEDRPTLVRPFAMLPEDAILRAAADNGITGRPPRVGRDRDWMERLLADTPGERIDLLKNLVNAPDRIREDYLT